LRIRILHEAKAIKYYQLRGRVLRRVLFGGLGYQIILHRRRNDSLCSSIQIPVSNKRRQGLKSSVLFRVDTSYLLLFPLHPQMVAGLLHCSVISTGPFTDADRNDQV
jgi:hypothetical protein